MFWLALAFMFFVNVTVSYEMDRYFARQRQTKLFKEVMQEELKKIQAEKLATPGGEIWKSPQPLECCGRDINECECIK